MNKSEKKGIPTTVCENCGKLIEYGPLCGDCFKLQHLGDRAWEYHISHIATLPRYEDVIGEIIRRAKARFGKQNLAYIQSICVHDFTIELRKGNTYYDYCLTCGENIHPF